MSRLILARKAFKDARVTVIGGGLLSFSLALLYVLLFPTIRDSFEEMQLPEYMEELAGAAGSYTTPAGFFAGEFFSAVPIVLVIFAIVAGTGATAGEESAGTLELLLSQPLRRRTVVFQKALGIGVAVSVAMFAGVPGVMLAKLFVDFDLGIGRIAIAMAMTVPLLLFFGALALLAGASFPARSLAVAATTAAAVAAYVLHTLGLLVDWLSDVRKASPFYWADASKPLTGDYEAWGAGILFAGAIVLVLLAAWFFERRDIGGGAREIGWKRWFSFRGSR